MNDVTVKNPEGLIAEAAKKYIESLLDDITYQYASLKSETTLKMVVSGLKEYQLYYRDESVKDE